MAYEAGAIMAKVGADIAGFQSGMAAVRGEMAATAGSTRSAGTQLAAVGRMATVGFTVPVVAAAALGARSFANFDRNMNVFAQTATGARGHMDEVRATAQRLGADLRLPGTSASDAGAAMLELARGGFSAKAAMDAARPTLQLSAAAQVDNARAAEIVADGLNTFGLSASHAASLVNELAGVSNATSASIDDVAAAMQMAGGVWNASGQSISTLNTAIGIMAQNGYKGSDAGTSLKTMMLSLTAPTAKSAKLMKDLGLNVYDAHGRMLPFRQVLGNMEGAFDGLTQKQRNAALATIFGSDAVRAANAMLNGGVKAWDRMGDAQSKSGNASRLAAAQNQGLAGVIDGLASTGESLAVTLGQMLAPTLIVVGQGAARLGGFIGGLSEPVRNTLAVMVGLAAAVPPILMVVGAVMRLRAAYMALGIAQTIGFGPMLLIVAVIAVVVAALVYAYNRYAWFRKGVQAALAGVGAAARAVAPVIGSALRWIAGIAGQVAGFIRAHWGTIRAVTLAVFSAIAAYVRVYMAVIKGVVQVGLAIIHGDWGRAWGLLKGMAGSALSAVRGVVGSALSSLAGFVVDKARAIGSAIVSGIASGITSGAGAIRDAAVGAARGALDAAKGWLHISSPSRVMHQQVGVPIAQGMAAGIMAASGLVGNAAQAAATLAAGARPAVTGSMVSMNSRPLGGGFGGPSGPSGGMVWTGDLIVEGSVITERQLIDTVRRGLNDYGRRTNTLGGLTP